MRLRRANVSIMTYCVVMDQTVNLALGRSGSLCCGVVVTWFEVRVDNSERLGYCRKSVSESERVG